ncbi:MAG: hypothetical protein WCJ95_09650 [Mariniphaga sp.]
MTLHETDSKITFLNYLNTALLTCVCTVLMFVFTVVDKIKTGQEDSGKEISRLKTIAEQTANDVVSLESRVRTLEKSNYIEMQAWVEANYTRKPQR